MLTRPVFAAVLVTWVTDIPPATLVVAAPARRACAEYAAERCAKIDVCSRNTQVAHLYGDASTCLVRETLGCESRVSAPDSHFTAAHVEACSAAIRRSSCGEWQKSTGCRPPPGARPTGASCSVGAQCTSTFCFIPRGAATGTCAELPSAGEPCAGTCSPGTFCGANGRCDALVDEGAPCNEMHYCAAGECCVRASEDADEGVCVRAANLGEPCDPRAVGAAGCDGFAMLTCGESSRLCEDDTLTTEQVMGRMSD